MRECDGSNPVAVALKLLHLLSRRRIPEPDRAVVRCRREQLAVVRECDGSNPVAVALKLLHPPSRRWIPEPDRAVARCRRKQLAVVRKRDRINPVAVTFELLHLLSRRWIPEPDRAVDRCRREQLAVVRECDGINRVAVAFELLKLQTPGRRYFRQPANPLYGPLKLGPYDAFYRCENDGGRIQLKRGSINDPPILQDEALCIGQKVRYFGVSVCLIHRVSFNKVNNPNLNELTAIID